MIDIEINEQRCTGCRLCVELCPMSVLEFEKEGGKGMPISVNPEACWACMTCSGKCPEAAIAIRIERLAVESRGQAARGLEDVDGRLHAGDEGVVAVELIPGLCLTHGDAAGGGDIHLHLASGVDALAGRGLAEHEA